MAALPPLDIGTVAPELWAVRLGLDPRRVRSIVAGEAAPESADERTAIARMLLATNPPSERRAELLRHYVTPLPLEGGADVIATALAQTAAVLGKTPEQLPEVATDRLWYRAVVAGVGAVTADHHVRAFMFPRPAGNRHGRHLGKNLDLEELYELARTTEQLAIGTAPEPGLRDALNELERRAAAIRARRAGQVRSLTGVHRSAAARLSIALMEARLCCDWSRAEAEYQLGKERSWFALREVQGAWQWEQLDDVRSFLELPRLRSLPAGQRLANALDTYERTAIRDAVRSTLEKFRRRRLETRQEGPEPERCELLRNGARFTDIDMARAALAELPVRVQPELAALLSAEHRRLRVEAAELVRKRRIGSGRAPGQDSPLDLIVTRLGAVLIEAMQLGDFGMRTLASRSGQAVGHIEALVDGKAAERPDLFPVAELLAPHLLAKERVAKELTDVLQEARQLVGLEPSAGPTPMVDTQPLAHQLGTYLQQARLDNGHGQADVARHLGTDKSRIRNLEGGRIMNRLALRRCRQLLACYEPSENTEHAQAVLAKLTDVYFAGQLRRLRQRPGIDLDDLTLVRAVTMDGLLAESGLTIGSFALRVGVEEEDLRRVLFPAAPFGDHEREALTRIGEWIAANPQGLWDRPARMPLSPLADDFRRRPRAVRKRRREPEPLPWKAEEAAAVAEAERLRTAAGLAADPRLAVLQTAGVQNPEVALATEPMPTASDDTDVPTAAGQGPAASEKPAEPADPAAEPEPDPTGLVSRTSGPPSRYHGPRDPDWTRPPAQVVEDIWSQAAVLARVLLEVPADGANLHEQTAVKLGTTADAVAQMFAADPNSEAWGKLIRWCGPGNGPMGVHRSWPHPGLASGSARIYADLLRAYALRQQRAVSPGELVSRLKPWLGEIRPAVVAQQLRQIGAGRSGSPAIAAFRSTLTAAIDAAGSRLPEPQLWRDGVSGRRAVVPTAELSEASGVESDSDATVPEEEDIEPLAPAAEPESLLPQTPTLTPEPESASPVAPSVDTEPQSPPTQPGDEPRRRAKPEPRARKCAKPEPPVGQEAAKRWVPGERFRRAPRPASAPPLPPAATSRPDDKQAAFESGLVNAADRRIVVYLSEVPPELVNLDELKGISHSVLRQRHAYRRRAMFARPGQDVRYVLGAPRLLEAFDDDVAPALEDRHWRTKVRGFFAQKSQVSRTMVAVQPAVPAGLAKNFEILTMPNSDLEVLEEVDGQAVAVKERARKEQYQAFAADLLPSSSESERESATTVVPSQRGLASTAEVHDDRWRDRRLFAWFRSLPRELSDEICNAKKYEALGLVWVQEPASFSHEELVAMRAKLARLRTEHRPHDIRMGVTGLQNLGEKTAGTDGPSGTVRALIQTGIDDVVDPAQRAVLTALFNGQDVPGHASMKASAVEALRGALGWLPPEQRGLLAAFVSSRPRGGGQVRHQRNRRGEFLPPSANPCNLRDIRQIQRRVKAHSLI